MLQGGALHEIMACYAALLTPEVRAWLSIKLASIFKHDIIELLGPAAKRDIQGIHEVLGYHDLSINVTHLFFEGLTLTLTIT